MLDLTPNAKAVAAQGTVEPSIVFEIDGYPTIFTSAEINEYIRIGDPDLFIGDDWFIGGVRMIVGQSAYMSFTAGGGTTTKIQQKLSPDRAQGSSISSMVISLIDKNEEISKLISPGFELADILGRNCTVSVGFKETAYPEDYNIVFRGIISDVESGPGFVNLLLANAEEKKRRPLISRGTTELSGAMSDSDTNFDVVDPSIFQQPVNGPDGSPDPDISFLIQIDDEVMTYDSISGNTINGVVRGVAGTTAVAHADQDDVSHGLRFQGNGMDIALKIMLSGWNDYFVTDVPAEIINNISITEQIDNAIFFQSINIIDKYGLTEGDWVTVSGAINGANNFTMRQISAIDTTNDGSYIIVDGAPLITEFESTAVVSFRSKYDSFGIGLKMSPAEVDVARHEFIRDTFLSTFTMDFYEFDIPITKDFIEQQLYLPMACFSVPRGGRSSVTYTIGPIAFNFIPTLDTSNVKNANNLRVKRSIASNFSNTIEYDYDYDIQNQKYKKVRTFQSTESKTRIPIGDKTLKVLSRGMRTSLAANGLAVLSAERLLGRYQYGAEFINGVQLLYGAGYAIQIGDVVLVDYADLQVTDFDTGDRQGQKKYMEVINQTLDNKTGEVTVDLLNTAFQLNDRFGVVSPSSKLLAGSTTTRLLLEKSWGTKPYKSEVQKWEDYIGLSLVVHSPDWSFREVVTLSALGSNPSAMLVSPPLSVAPSAGYIIDVEEYPTSTDPDINAKLKAMHAFFSPMVPVVAAASQTVIEVDPSDIGKFLVGAVVRINNFDYTDYSPEANVISVNTGTNEIEIDTATGFTVDSTHEIKLIGFADAGYSFRYI